MASSLKELWLAYFKGIACAKGEIAAENEGENGLAEDRWITIHPWGMSQSEADTGEGKGYYSLLMTYSAYSSPVQPVSRPVMTSLRSVNMHSSRAAESLSDCS